MIYRDSPEFQYHKVLPCKRYTSITKNERLLNCKSPFDASLVHKVTLKNDLAYQITLLQ